MTATRQTPAGRAAILAVLLAVLLSAATPAAAFTCADRQSMAVGIESFIN